MQIWVHEPSQNQRLYPCLSPLKSNEAVQWCERYVFAGELMAVSPALLYTVTIYERWRKAI